MYEGCCLRVLRLLGLLKIARRLSASPTSSACLIWGGFGAHDSHDSSRGLGFKKKAMFSNRPHLKNLNML